LDKIPLLDDSLDAVIHPFSPWSLPVLDRLAAEFYRLLKPEGRVFVTGWPPPPARKFQGPAASGLTGFSKEPGFALWTLTMI